MRYAAFISYRHTPGDMEMAKRVHTGLETYVIPKSVRHKIGRKKIGRVFRDQEELPIGSDLDDNISKALEESGYLLVICSPRTPESYWVCKEIESFIKMHDRNHVLAVLIEGEPAESFPPQLLVDENGNPVEPLAADVRGATKKEVNAKFKTELLRLAAPLIGCTYDELRQRDRDRRIKRAVSIVTLAASVITLAGTAFGIYNANVAARMKQLANEKSRLAEEISIQYDGKLENQSRFYAEEALTLFKQGSREDAALVAIEGLPSEDNDRPYVADAEYALSKVLYAYSNSNDFTIDRVLQHDLPVDYLKRSDDSSMLVTIDEGGRVYLWNAKDWSLITKIQPVIDDSNYYEEITSADADSTGLYVTTEHNIVKYDFDGNKLYELTTGDMIVQCEACGSEGKMILVGTESISILDTANGNEIAYFNNDTDASFRSEGRYVVDNNKFYTYGGDHKSEGAYISVIDLKDNSYKSIEVTDGVFLDFTVTQDNQIATLVGNKDMVQEGVTKLTVDFFDENYKKIWSRDLDTIGKNLLTYYANIRAHTYSVKGEKKSEVVVTSGTDAFTLNGENGEMVKSFNLPGEATMLAMIVDSPYVRVGYRQGNIDFVDFSTGRVYSEFEITTNFAVKDAALFNDKIILSSYSAEELHIFSWHDAPDLEEFVTFEGKETPSITSPDGSYFATTDYGEYTNANFYDKDGKKIYTFDKGEFIYKIHLFNDKVILQDKRSIWIIHLFEGKEEEITLEDLGLDMYTYSMSLSKDGKGAAIWDSRNIAAIDLEKREILVQASTESTIGKVLINSDLDKLYVSEGKDTLYEIDIDAKATREFKGENLSTVANSYSKEFIALSPDDKLIAICCRDGYVRLVNTESYETEAMIPLQTYLSAFVGFTDDCTHVIMQGDDYKVRIWDIENKCMASSIDTSATVRQIICDEEDNLMALAVGYGMLLYETNGYGCIGSATEGMFYLKSNNSILVSSDQTEVSRTYYKDYKQLIEEAKKQFPGAQLSEEKKVKYNIN
jgi:WD40 repeat protein